MTPGGYQMTPGNCIPITGGADKGNKGGKGDKGHKGGKGDYGKGGKGSWDTMMEDILWPNLNDVARNDFGTIVMRFKAAEDKHRQWFGRTPFDHLDSETDVDAIYAWYDRCLERHRHTLIEESGTSASSSSSPTGRRTSKGGKGDKGDKDGKGTDDKDKKSKRGGPYTL